MTQAQKKDSDDGVVTPLASSAGRLSVLGNLEKRREEIKAKATIDLPVPRWKDPVIKVRFKPVDHAILQRGQDAAAKAKGTGKRSEAVVQANIAVLAAGVVEVFAVLDDPDERFSLRKGEPDGDLTAFDADLAENLGCDPTAAAVIKSLYMFDGDIISTATAIAEFSGYKDQEADDELVGE